MALHLRLTTVLTALLFVSPAISQNTNVLIIDSGKLLLDHERLVDRPLQLRGLGSVSWFNETDVRITAGQVTIITGLALGPQRLLAKLREQCSNPQSSRIPTCKVQLRFSIHRTAMDRDPDGLPRLVIRGRDIHLLPLGSNNWGEN